MKRLSWRAIWLVFLVFVTPATAFAGDGKIRRRIPTGTGQQVSLPFGRHIDAIIEERPVDPSAPQRDLPRLDRSLRAKEDHASSLPPSRSTFRPEDGWHRVREHVWNAFRVMVEIYTSDPSEHTHGHVQNLWDMLAGLPAAEPLYDPEMIEAVLATKSPHVGLSLLFAAMFKTDTTLRIYLAETYGQRFVITLPGAGASLLELAYEAERGLTQRGLIDANLFNQLVERIPDDMSHVVEHVQRLYQRSVPNS